MSIKRVIKMMGRVGDAARKASNTDSKLFRDATNELGRGIQERLIDGILGGYDIHGHKFKGLENSTINVRRYRGIGGSSPLRAGGGILDFLNSGNLFMAGKLQVQLNRPSEEYMMHQNEGFTPTYVPAVRKNGELAVKRGGELQFIDNKNGASVPARKWFGIPKTYQVGGTKYNEFLKKVENRLQNVIESALKGG